MEIDDKKFYVYYLIDPHTNIPFYVGKGNGNRLFNHEWDVNKGKIPHKNKYLFYKIKKINKFGKNIIYRKIIENLNESDAFNIEKQEIKKFGRKNNKTGILCNMTDGGEGSSGFIFSKHSINKIKNSLKKHYGIYLSKNLGKRHSKKTKLKLSQLGFLRKNSLITRKKISDSLKGKKHSEETKIKISNSHKGLPNLFKGISRTDEIKKKISNANDFRKKQILQLNNSGDVIKQHRGISEAARELKIQKSNLIKCLKGKSFTCGGYKWKYVKCEY